MSIVKLICVMVTVGFVFKNNFFRTLILSEFDTKTFLDGRFKVFYFIGYLINGEAVYHVFFKIRLFINWRESIS
jgi:hypothetical protein